MRIFYFGNNRLGAAALRWLVDRPDVEIVGAALHPAEGCLHGDELRQVSELTADRIFPGDRLRDPEVVRAIADLAPDLGLSVLFGYILKPALLEIFPRGCYNLHPAYLPWNRGAHPNVWSIVDGTPAGVTLHRIDAGVDTGPVVARRQVTVEPTDTGATLYRKLERAGLALMTESWQDLAAGTAGEEPQDSDAGSNHLARDLAALDEIDLDTPCPPRALIDRLRARTFAPHAGCWFRDGDGRRVQVRVELSYLEDET